MNYCFYTLLQASGTLLRMRQLAVENTLHVGAHYGICYAMRVAAHIHSATQVQAAHVRTGSLSS